MDEQMRKRAYAICRNKHNGDDAWHNAVIKLLNKYNSENLEDINLAGLLHSALITCIIDLKRTTMVQKGSVELKYAEQLIVNDEYRYYNSMQISEIMEYLGTVGSRDREIFLMVMFGMDSKSVAEATSESNDNVRKIVSRLRLKIKNKFKNEREYC